MRARLLAACLSLSAAAACSNGPESASRDAGAGGATHTATSPSLDRAWLISTHNSYWVDRGITGDLYASGVQERLLDQLLADHARGVEIDIHKDPSAAKSFAVFHTMPGNVLCDSLARCLGVLRAFHYASPRHHAVHITLELKELEASNFDATHTIEDLDALLTKELGALLYRPADLLARCSGDEAKTLSACAEAKGMPEVDDLRGRFLVHVLGNWTGLPGAQATKDWADYANHAPITERAAFSMASSWQLDRESLNGTVYSLITQAEIDSAFKQTVFMQIEDAADANAEAFLARRGVIRVDDAFSAADQTTRIASGYQLLQTDTPWVQADDHGPGRPVRSLDPRFSDASLAEEGSRVRLGPGLAGERVFAQRPAEASGTTTWETAASSGSVAERVGCLRAETAGGDSIAVCRFKVAADRMPPDGGPTGSPDAEQVHVRVEVCRAGACSSNDHASSDPAPDGPGDLLKLVVDNVASGMSCATAWSAGSADAELAPAWVKLGDPVCFASPLTAQGIATATPDDGSLAEAWLFGTRAGGRQLSAADFPAVVAVTGAGASRTDPSLAADL